MGVAIQVTDYQKLLENSEKAVVKDPKQLGVCLVTGAAGFLGRNIVKTLIAQGCQVKALINRTPLDFEHDNLEMITGSITDAEAMAKACEGVDTVFHVAALIALMGGSQVTDEYFQRAYDTNVNGTKNLLKAASEAGAKRFIHTSSVDVCFNYIDEADIPNTAAYAKEPRSVYQQTKILAEKAVLEANGQNGMFTCAVRPGGIFGDEENEVIDRFLEQLMAGRLLMRIGDGSALMDNSYVGNLVHGEILAALHLGENGSANGKPYFINDNEPMNSFEFFRPLIEGLGYKMPRLYLPGGFLVPFLKLLETIVFKLGLNEPPLVPHAIYKVAVTHYGCTKSAKEDIAYEPIKSVSQAMAEALEYCKSQIATGKA